MHALAYLSEGKAAVALQAISELLDKIPEHERGWCVRGACLLRMGNLDEAMLSFNRAIALDRQDYFPVQEKAKCMMMGMKFKDAETLFARSLRLNAVKTSEDRENKADSLFLFSFCQMLMGDSAAAASSIEQAFDAEPLRTYQSVEMLFTEVFAHSPHIHEAERKELKLKLDFLLNELVKPIERMRKMRIRKAGA